MKRFGDNFIQTDKENHIIRVVTGLTSLFTCSTLVLQIIVIENLFMFENYKS
jgi:hypothetical protein